MRRKKICKSFYYLFLSGWCAELVKNHQGHKLQDSCLKIVICHQEQKQEYDSPKNEKLHRTLK